MIVCLIVSSARWKKNICMYHHWQWTKMWSIVDIGKMSNIMHVKAED